MTKKILLVEDDLIIAMVNQLMVTSFGYDVITANTGEQAVTFAEEDADIHLILMDINRCRMVKRYFHKLGHLIWVDVTIALVRDSAGAPHYFIAQIQNISESKAAQTSVENLLKEKDILLQEVHHRVKNNMNTMASLLSLQASAITDVPTANLFKDAVGRLKTMGTLYDNLYKSENYSNVSVQAYLSQLVDEAQNLFMGYPVVIEKDIENFDLTPKTLSSLGIIVNELITNGIKHAFPNGQNGEIKITLTRKSEKASLVYQDNGVGITASTKRPVSFGLKLIDLLVHQLQGNLEIENKEGTVIKIEFPMKQ